MKRIGYELEDGRHFLLGKIFEMEKEEPRPTQIRSMSTKERPNRGNNDDCSEYFRCVQRSTLRTEWSPVKGQLRGRHVQVKV